MLENYLIRGLIIGLVFGVPAGAIGALTIQRSLTYGFLPELFTGLGSSAADVIYACVGVFGVTAVSDFLSAHQKPISMIGGILIIAMGVIIFHKEASSIRDAGQTTKLATLFVSSFLIAVANPATILSFLLPLQPLASVHIPHLGRAFN